MHAGPYRLTTQFQMKLPCVFAQRIERLFDITSSYAASELQSCQPMVGQTDPLIAVIAAVMAGSDVPIGDHADLRVARPNHHRCVLQRWRNRITIAVEVDACMGTHDRRDHFVRVERKSW